MQKLKNEIVEFIKNYVQTSRAKGVVVGMSGGKDSYVVAKLACLAVGSENVFGVIMPNAKMTDIEIAKEECDELKIKYKVIDVSLAYGEILNSSQSAVQYFLNNQTELSSISTINLAPRIRMTILYTIAGSLGFLVANTSNLSERMVGYSTKWGDNVGDFAPLANLTKSEVCELGIALGLNQKYVNKIPDDGISGKTDEMSLGFSYDELDAFIRKGVKAKNFDKILSKYNSSKHKREPVSSFDTTRKNYFEEM